MSIITAFPGIKRSVVYPFCFLPFLGLFFMKLTITFSAILSLCRFGDHVLLFSGSTAMMLVFQASCSQISCDFFSPCFTCFKRAFLQLRSPPSPCQLCEKWWLHKNKEKSFSIFPTPYLPKVPDRTASKYSPPPGPNGWTCSCGCAGDSNRSN